MKHVKIYEINAMAFLFHELVFMYGVLFVVYVPPMRVDEPKPSLSKF